MEKLKRMISYKLLFYALLIINIFALSLVFTPLTNYLYSFLEVNPEIKKADAIILLTGGAYTNEILEGQSYQRLFHAFKLYKKKYADKIIICGGPSKEELLPRSEIMKNILIDMGVNKNDIIIEKNSKSSYENIKNIMTLLKELNVKNSLLVTSSYHMYRSLAVCKKLGINVYPAPVPCYEKDISHFWRRSKFIPDILREYAVIIYFWLRGWI